MPASSESYDPVRGAALAPAEVERMTNEALAAIIDATDFDELKKARLAHLGREAPLTLANAEIGALQPEAKVEADRDRQVLEDETADVTLPWDSRPVGARHPVTMLAERLADVFVGMGYEIAEGPEVEAEWYNFDALNFPPDHPARELQ